MPVSRVNNNWLPTTNDKHYVHPNVCEVSQKNVCDVPYIVFNWDKCQCLDNEDAFRAHTVVDCLIAKAKKHRNALILCF